MEKLKNVRGRYGKTYPSSTFLESDDTFLSIDWFTCTFDFVQLHYKKAPFDSWQFQEYEKGMVKLQRLFELLTFPDESERTFEDYSIGGYRQGFITLGEHIKIFFGGAINSNKLYHNKLEMSGQACKDFVERGGDWFQLFSWLLSNGANFTRVDCAIDVFTDKYFTMEKLYTYAKKYWYVSPLRKWSYEHGGDSSTETFIGETLYFGSAYSNTLICIYDKKLERFRYDIEVFVPTWIRVEIRFKQERASWFINNFLGLRSGDHDFSFISKALFAVLEFKEPTISGRATKDSNKSRWDTAQWWLDFLKVSEKADFSHEKKISTLEKKIDWMERSVSRSLSQVYVFDSGHFLEFIFTMIRDKIEDFNNLDFSIINNKRRKEKLPEICKEDVIKIKDDIENLLIALKESVADE